MEYANIPQNIERIFIVAFAPKQVKNYADFQFPEKIEETFARQIPLKLLVKYLNIS